MEVDINSLSRPGCVLLSGLQRARRQTHYTCERPDSLSHLFLSFALNVDLKNDCMLRVISLSKNRVYKGLWQTKPKHLSDKNFDLYFAEFYIFTLNVRPRKIQKFTQSNSAFHFVANNYNFLGRVGGWGSLEMWLNTVNTIIKPLRRVSVGSHFDFPPLSIPTGSARWPRRTAWTSSACSIPWTTCRTCCWAWRLLELQAA